jgi:hypothetical protein
MRLFGNASRTRKTAVSAGITATLLATLLGGSVAIAPAAQSSTLPHCNSQLRFDISGEMYYIPALEYPGGTSSTIRCKVHQGASGGQVLWLQRALNRCYQQGLVEDGKFGAKTYAALKRVQKRVGVNDDGKYGPQTRNAMQWPMYRLSDGKYNRCRTVRF